MSDITKVQSLVTSFCAAMQDGETRKTEEVVDALFEQSGLPRTKLATLVSIVLQSVPGVVIVRGKGGGVFKGEAKTPVSRKTEFDTVVNLAAKGQNAVSAHFAHVAQKCALALLARGMPAAEGKALLRTLLTDALKASATEFETNAASYELPEAPPEETATATATA